MARKIMIVDNENRNVNEDVLNNKSKEKKQRKKANKSTVTIILLILVVTSLAANVVLGIQVYKLDEDSKELIRVREDLDNVHENYSAALRTISGLTGDDSVSYVKEKLNFFDNRIVFQISGYGNYYYTYDCMMKKVDGSYTFWAYNTEAAKSKGLKAGNC